MIFSVILSAVLITTAIISWKGLQERGDSKDTRDDGDVVTLDWYINYSWFNDVWGESAVSKEITDRTGVNINFITPVGQESNTLETMINSDTLPDLVTLGYWEPQVNEMIEERKVFALNALADQYDPLFYDVADPDAVKRYTTSDGNIYAYPNSSCTLSDFQEHDDIPSNQVFVVRKDIYEAIGCPDMTTPEGFSDAVRKATATFPEVDGEPLIPIGANFFDDTGCTSFDNYLFNFLAIPHEKNGVYYDRNTDPEYIRWLKTFRKLNEEGYLSGDIFVDERTQITEKIRNGRYFCMIYQWTDMKDQINEIYRENPDQVYIAVDGPRNSAGDPPVLPSNYAQGWTVTLVSKNCKNPAAAIKLMDFLMSREGQMLTSIGVEGVTYEMKDGKPVMIDTVREMMETDRPEFDRIYGADNTYWMLQDNIMQMEWEEEPSAPIKEMKEYTYPYAAYTGQYAISIPESTTLGRKYVDMLNLWSVTLKKLLTAESDQAFDQILQEYVDGREALGYEEVHAEETRQIRENKARLGLTEDAE